MFSTILTQLERDKQLTRSEIINAYEIGSRVYGTHHDKSDYDYYVIVVSQRPVMEIETSEYSIHLYTEDTFQKALDDHEIAFIEALSHPVILKKELTYTLDRTQLRSAISKKADHSFTKAKKKMTVEAPKYPADSSEALYEIYLGKKSLFHAFRILDFGIQLAQHGGIQNFSSMNALHKEIMESPNESPGNVWIHLEKIYKSQYNAKKTAFRLVCPI